MSLSEGFTWPQWTLVWLGNFRLVAACVGLSVILATVVIVALVFYKEGRLLR